MPRYRYATHPQRIKDSSHGLTTGYAPTFDRDWRIIRRHLTPRGSFVDYGAGLGRVTILAAHLPFDRVVGIELDADLVKRGNNTSAPRGNWNAMPKSSARTQRRSQFRMTPQCCTFNNPFSGSARAFVRDMKAFFAYGHDTIKADGIAAASRAQTALLG